MQKTILARQIETADAKARFDKACKRLIANKLILAWIMKHTMEEYSCYNVREIAEEYIEGNPVISKKMVHRDESDIVSERNMFEDSSKQDNVFENSYIHGDTTEDATMTEGMVTFDIRFRAIVPQKGECITLVINVEAQNEFYPGYPLIKRGIYYCCRLISGQYGTEFRDSHYEDIKKVYSIWICINPPKHRQNTITKYEISEKNLLGDVKEVWKDYDLLAAVMICLKTSIEEDSSEKTIVDLLSTLLSSDMKVDDKKAILERDFDIAMTKEIGEEVKEMCNYGDYIEEKALQRGMQKGMQKGIFVTLSGLVKEGILTLEDAAKRMNISKTDFQELLETQK